ncbi:MAG: DinB family protein [Saprospiraceae bacterium]
MQNFATQLNNQLLAEVRRRLYDENVVRLNKCLDDLTLDEIWHKPNAHSNSIGNLVLHLCGNVSQWVLAGIGGQTDTRERQWEFDSDERLTKVELKEKVAQVMEQVELVLQQISPADLLEKRAVQCYEETPLSILIHVVEHFSYHVGQMTYVVKLWKDQDMGYYADVELERKDGNG